MNKKEESHIYIGHGLRGVRYQTKERRRIISQKKFPYVIKSRKNDVGQTALGKSVGGYATGEEGLCNVNEEDGPLFETQKFRTPIKDTIRKSLRNTVNRSW